MHAVLTIGQLLEYWEGSGKVAEDKIEAILQLDEAKIILVEEETLCIAQIVAQNFLMALSFVHPVEQK